MSTCQQITYPNKEKHLKVVYRQLREAMFSKKVTCRCGHASVFGFVFRCFFCGEFFCSRCARDHFGCKDYVCENGSGI